MIEAIHWFGFFALFLFSYTVSFQMWARISDSEVARIIRFPAFCLWRWEIPILVIGGMLVSCFGSDITIYIGVIYLGFYCTLFMIDYYSCNWTYYTPSTYAQEIWRIRTELRRYRDEHKKPSR